jgi:hypothetical protein
MCDCCQRLKNLIDRKPRTMGRLIIWHQEDDMGDNIQVSIQRDDRTEVGTGDTVEAAIESLEQKLADYG